jgi:hypothetical protein
MRSMVVLRRIVAAILLIVIGIIHLMIIKVGLHLQMYLGVLFIIDVVAAFISALWIAFLDAWGGWLLGLLAALGPLIGYILTRTMRLPGLHILPTSSIGDASVVIEAIVIVFAIWALTQPSRTTTRATTTV